MTDPITIANSTPGVDKTVSLDDVIDQLRSGMTLGIGGWGSRRKPMALVRAIIRSSITDLTVASYGGPDVGMLCAAGKVRRLICPFVSLDTIPLEPHYRAARQSGAVEDHPMDEGQFLLALQAAAWRVPFLPSRVGLGSDLFRDDPNLKTVTSPYPDESGHFETLTAVAALHLDAAIVHMSRSDVLGNCASLGPDPYFDDLMAEASSQTWVSCEQIVPTAELSNLFPLSARRMNRMFVTGIVEAPNGAHFTSCDGDYGRDEAAQRDYAASAKQPTGWDEYRAHWVDIDEAAYQARLTDHTGAVPKSQDHGVRP